MSLGSKQRKFTLMVAQLIQWAYDNGYELTVGDAYRDPRLHGQVGEKKGYGASSSCHKLRLAVDLNLFIGGVYQTSSEAYTPLGEYWESIGGSWGGRFQDGNHFSVEHEGKK
jgi:hypothetical protein